MTTGFQHGFEEGGPRVRDEISQPAEPNLQQQSNTETNKWINEEKRRKRNESWQGQADGERQSIKSIIQI